MRFQAHKIFSLRVQRKPLKLHICSLNFVRCSTIIGVKWSKTICLVTAVGSNVWPFVYLCTFNSMTAQLALKLPTCASSFRLCFWFRTDNWTKVFNKLNSATKAWLKFLKINTKDCGGLSLNCITQTMRRGKAHCYTTDVSKIKNFRAVIRYDFWVEGYSIQCASCADIWSQEGTCDVSQAPHLPQSPPCCLAPCVGWPWRLWAWALHVECIMPGRSTAFVLCVWKALYWSPGEMEGPLVQQCPWDTNTKLICSCLSLYCLLSQRT